MSNQAHRRTPLLDEIQVGVIGGSGFYQIEGLEDAATVSVERPSASPQTKRSWGHWVGYGSPFCRATALGIATPSEVPARANIYALKALGATHVVSISAVGSLRQELAPRDVVIPDQLLDRTKGVRPASFFGEGVVAHISFGEPYCPEVSAILVDVARQTGGGVHAGGTLVVMEGPQFSTKAESQAYRQLGAHLIGMTALPEAKLAREAELCYATLAMVTDYDCWHESEEHVTVEMVVANMQANVARAKAIVKAALPRIAASAGECACGHALAGAIMTRPDAIPKDRRQQLDLLIGKYLP